MPDTAIDARNTAFAKHVQADPEASALLFLSAAGPWIPVAQGQLILLNLANMLPRMGRGFRHIVLDARLDAAIATELSHVHGEGRLRPTLLRQLEAAVEGQYEVSSRYPEGSIAIVVGGATGRQAGWNIYTDGWEVGFSRDGGPNRKYGDPTQFNPIAAQVLAASISAIIYRMVARPESALERPMPASVRWSVAGTDAKVELPRTIVFPDVTLVGAGAVAQAAFASLRYVEQVCGELTVIEPDRADKTNLNRYMLLERTDAEREQRKTEVLRKALTPTQLTITAIAGAVQSVANRVSKNVILAVDDVETRWFVQQRWPNALLEAGTRSESFHVAHSHRQAVWSGRMACQGCLHPDSTRIPREIREATAVFVSALTGAILAREIHLWFGNSTEAKIGRLSRGYIAGDAWEPWTVEASPFMPVPSCPICGSSPHGASAGRTTNA